MLIITARSCGREILTLISHHRKLKKYCLLKDALNKKFYISTALLIMPTFYSN